MCTVSWLIDADGYQLFDNRDESRHRLPALPPSVMEEKGVRYTAPTDADAGGTWIGVNEHGVALTLLNAWDIYVAAPPAGFLSRGSIVREQLDVRSVDELSPRLSSLDLPRYQGFRLVAFERGCRAPTVLAWDGEELVTETPSMPLASSSRGSAEAHRERRQALDHLASAEGLQGDALLERLHTSHFPERGPWSVCMHREDARTVSATHVSVSGARVALRYAPGPPCRTPFGAPLELPLRGA